MSEYKPRNREKTNRPKPGIFWCDKCDANYVTAGEICNNCGHKDTSRGSKFTRRNKIDKYKSL